MQQNAWEEPGNETRIMHDSSITCDKLYFVKYYRGADDKYTCCPSNVLFVPQFLSPQCIILYNSVINTYT